MLTLTSGASAVASSGWQLQASSDGRHWHALAAGAKERFPFAHQTRVFGIEKLGRFAYYRLSFPANTGSTARSLSEIELIGPAE